MRSLHFSGTVVLVLAGLALPATGQTTPDPQTKTFPWEGEVTGTNVYVRSGAGSNYYPTAKVGPGTRVLVTGERFGWYQIVPPAGSFSYIDTTMVDRAAGARTATVNQDRVYVRAGSELERRKTSSQTVVNKGATVEILGEADGFYKIVPPRDASLYISIQYVKFVPQRLRTGLLEKFMAGGPMPKFDTPPMPATADGAKSPSPVAVRPSATAVPQPLKQDPTVVSDSAVDSEEQSGEAALGVPKPVDESALPIETDASSIVTVDENRAPIDTGSVPGAKPKAAAPAQAGPGRFDATLQILETEMQTELRKPLTEQGLTSLRDRYQPIAEQTDEYVPAAIAKIRLRQINDRIALQAGRAKLVSESSEVDAFRRQQEEDRKHIDELVKRRLPPAEEFDLQGELRRSFAFAPEKRRYRLVDPGKNTTLAYVDVPREIEPDVERMVGRPVGIKAAGREYSTAARMTIVVAAKIVDLTPSRDVPEAGKSARNSGPAEGNTNERPAADAGRPARGQGVGVASDDAAGHD